ncbi:hypothetical protein KC19_5G058600 [Ceratodon purpureus]|uniref:Uncharacterized protein n=1 Tax=Ceratodon purpureus TaxID=3225 RepID=A0A8T0HZ37_CERPU|nr:hypothetical protein KC19_5G058600 [Ceratodon purpureus]
MNFVCQSRMMGTRLCTILFLLTLIAITEFAGVHGVATLDSFCEKANSYSNSTCPDVSTFDIVDPAAYAGMWYEIGSTAQFKLLSEAGLDCLQSNYTLQLPNDPSGAALAVVNSGERSMGAIATLAITSISTGAKEICMNARDVCSYIGPSSAMMQSVTELRIVSDKVKSSLPEQAATLDDVAQKVENYAYNVSKEFTMLAKHVAKIQTMDGFLSAGNDSATNVDQLKLDMIAMSKHIDVFVEFMHEMDIARSLLAQVAVKLVLAGEFVCSVDITEASALIAAAEQSISLRAARMRSTHTAMNAASEVLQLADLKLPNNLSWSSPGVATQNATARGRLEFSILGLSDPYVIIALEGLPSRGYDAALLYSCTEDRLLDTIQQSFFVLSRRPTLQPATLNRFLAVASSLGIDLDCENPFLPSSCNGAPEGDAPTSM